MKYIKHQQSKGVALIVALFVLAALSFLLAAVLADVESEIKMSAIERNSERALKIAETGIQIARATFLQEGAFQDLTTTEEIINIDGFIQGGYFFTTLGAGLPGGEKWVQWHYDAGITGYNNETEITENLRHAWRTGRTGRNGYWKDVGGFNYYFLNNLYGIVAGRTYFAVEGDTDTMVRAHNEYTGRVEWTQSLAASPNSTSAYAVAMSPMASYTEVAGDAIVRQVLYFTYSGEAAGGGAGATLDTTSTVRLRAANPDNSMTVLWEFDTGMHGIGSAPAFFDPSPGEPGDELIYFAVTALPGADLRPNTSAGVEAMLDYPNTAAQASEQIYLFAIVDTTDDTMSSPGFIVKWTHPFPDPALVEETDYATEQATGTNGQNPPYIRIPADNPFDLKGHDLLPDYRLRTATGVQQERVYGNVYNVFDPPSVSHPMISVAYAGDDDQDGSTDPGELTANRSYADNAADPIIDIYLMYATYSRAAWSTNTGIIKDTYYYSGDFSGAWNRISGNKKQVVVQTRILSLRDTLTGTCGADGTGCAFNWNTSKSRSPEFKWTYRLLAWDPSHEDARPWNGYGEFTWDTWFEQQVAPMIGTKDRDQDGTQWVNIAGNAGGQRSLYTVLYPAYESMGFMSSGGSDNMKNNVAAPPTTAQGSPVTFNSSDWDYSTWDDSRLMVMAIRDTWDDWKVGNRTNVFGTNLANPKLSNPVEPYWTHLHNGGSAAPEDIICNADGSIYEAFYPDEEETVMAFPGNPGDAINANAAKEGFPRPYVWWEALWEAKLRGGNYPHRDLDSQGWAAVDPPIDRASYDLDVEGETSAFCPECANGDGLIVSVFNHDIVPDWSSDWYGYEDMRVHGINARTGRHIWDYHIPAKLMGDYYNGTPAIGNGRVFVAYQEDRRSLLQVFNASTGEYLQRVTVDDDSDAVIMSPTIANGAVYVGTYDHNEGNPQSPNMNFADDAIRLFALSPVLRLLSVGVYPASTSLFLGTSEAGGDMGLSRRMPRAERRLQVQITGTGSKWEEVRDIYQE